jgi:hypothetical protein
MTPSWMRAPPLSFRPITGQPFSSAWSMRRQILRALASLMDPPKTVKSWAKTATCRPSIVPVPVTMPSPTGLFFSMPISAQRWVTKTPLSMKLPSSRSRWIRSRAVRRPLAWILAIRWGPPPCRACSRSAFKRWSLAWKSSGMALSRGFGEPG